MTPTSTIQTQALERLAAWFPFAMTMCTPIDAAGRSCYGMGMPHWGVQANCTAMAGLAALGSLGQAAGVCDAATAEAAHRQALAMLRHCLDTHVSGPGIGDDRQHWGRNWISPLAIERSASAIALLLESADDDLRQAWQRLLASEADYACHHHDRGGHRGIPTGLGGPHGGCNAPESNLWCAAICWRAACSLPGHAEAPAWRAKAIDFFINGVSIPSDADNQTVYDQATVAARHLGPNFYEGMALPHHGYANVGYMVICTSQLAMIGLDAQAAGWELPEAIDLHARELFQAVRVATFDDGRLARVGGDTRARYCYCQDYLPISLCWAAARGWLPDAGSLISGQLAWTAADQQADGAFLMPRLAWLKQTNPLAYLRLEGDRAAGLAELAIALHHRPDLLDDGQAAACNESWHDPDYGIAVERSPHRLASIAWSAENLAQALCLPPDDSSLAEWRFNLTGRIDIMGKRPNRRLLDFHIERQPGGFASAGLVEEGHGLKPAEGWTSTDSLPCPHHIAVAALPDGHSMLGINCCRAGDHGAWVTAIRGLHLAIPNDSINGWRRRISGADGEHDLRRPLPSDEIIALGSWASVEHGRIAAFGIGPSSELILEREVRSDDGPYSSIQVERICSPYWTGLRRYAPGEAILESAWACIAQVDEASIPERAASSSHLQRDTLRGAAITGLDGIRYGLVLNTGSEAITCTAADLAALGLEAAAPTLAPGHCHLICGG